MHVAYYRGFNLSKLLHQHTYLMLVLELLYHRDNYKAKYLRYYQLHRELNDTLKALGKGPISNSTFDHYIKCCKDKKLISHTHYKGESRFTVTSRAITYIEELRIKKPDYADMRVVYMPKNEPRNAWKNPFESVGKVSDRVSCVVTHAKDRKNKEIPLSEMSTKIGPNTIIRLRKDKDSQPSSS
jgi:hypothetical protein